MATNFKVMTWNLENFFPANTQYGPSTQAIFDTKVAYLADTISRIAPDLLAVQEVGDPAPFAALQGQLAGSYPHASLSAHPDPRGIRVGFLSKLPLTQVAELHNFPNTALTNIPDAQGNILSHMGRGALKVTVEPKQGLLINVITTHLKSKLITYPNNRRFPHNEDERARETGVALIKRAVEAIALRVYANSLVTNNNDPLIVLGDLNDGPEAVTTQMLLGPEDGSLSRRDKSDDVRLYNLATYILDGRRYSRIYKKNQELIDHILVSYELIFEQRQVDSYVESIQSITESVSSRRDATHPDHAPVFARFELP
jgi:endonuclease/exonuclease/phosphatase family metal-dependent hydrolase